MLLKMSFFDKIGTFFDIIPKLIYFLSAVFLSAIDVLQCLVRKLAGLDVYYAQDAGTTNWWGNPTLEPVAKQDPLTEFIYGILGYGDSAPLYKGLNTVFWSLTVFAILCLAVTTMIAIIKSHYNEDAGATSPWKYVYTACKAVLTFAIVPFTVVIGMKLASWTLTTLDSITAGSATEETISSLYGPEATSHFESGSLPGDEGGTKYYSRYDFFGFGTYTSSTPFSGMLFKACSFDANRARENVDYAEALTKLETGKGTDGIKVFGQTAEYKSLTSDEAKAAYIADQVDFAFMNTLRLEGSGYHGQQVVDALQEYGAKTWDLTDWINGLMTHTNSFSKWHVGFVWQFYNLWSYNFIVAFGGGVTLMGLFLSIIIGLMSRLMKGAALFLIYPTLLGIAPLDNFKAFKSWVQQFMQQIMMAFGSIIGLNLALLVLPYVQNIRFFGIAVVDSIVNLVLTVTALMLTKDFISIVSNFVGGANALSVGDGLKGDVGKTIAKGATTAGLIGLGATAGVIGGGAALISKTKTALTGGKQGAMRRAQGSVDAAKRKVDEAGGTKSSLVDGVKDTDAFKAYKGEQEDKGVTDEDAIWKGYLETHQEDENVKKVISAEKWLGNAEYELEQAQAERDKVARRFGFKQNDDGDVVSSGTEKNKDGEVPVYKFKEGDEKLLRAGYTTEEITDPSDPSGKKTKRVYYDKDGKQVSRAEALDPKTFVGGAINLWEHGKQGVKDWFDSQTMANAGKHLADGFLKGVANLGSAAGLDKMMKGMTDIFSGGLTFKGGVFDDKGKKPEGDKLAEANHAAAQTAADQRLKKQLDSNDSLLKAFNTGLSGVAKAIEKLGEKFTSTGSSSTGSGK